jgi:hypothetical protein
MSIGVVLLCVKRVLVSLCELVVRLVGQTLSLSVAVRSFYNPSSGS